MTKTTFAAKLTAKAEIYDELVSKYETAVDDCEKYFRAFLNTDSEGYERDYAYSRYLDTAAEIEVCGDILHYLNPDEVTYMHPSWVVDGIVERVSQE